jgi:CubicO group peptidase (beta-lactamase class C family)
MNALALVLATVLSLDQIVSRAGSGVLLVRRGDTVLYERAWGDGVTPDHLFDIGSITKMMTTVAVLQTMPLDLRVGDVFPEAPPDKAAITVEQLLAHKSGLSDSLGLDETVIKRPFFLSKVWKAPLGEPGYSNTGYSLLAAMLEVRTKMPYAAYMQRHVFKPANVEIGYQRRARLVSGTLNGTPWGSTADYFGIDGPGWYLMGNGAMLASVRELDRWFAALWSGKLLGAEKTRMLRERLTRKDKWGRTILFSSGANNIFSSHYEWWPDENVTFILFTSDSEWPKEKLLPLVRPVIVELAAAR